jgi:hypothetical protein
MEPSDREPQRVPARQGEAAHSLAERTLERIRGLRGVPPRPDEELGGRVNGIDDLRSLVRRCLNSFLDGVEEDENGSFSFQYESTRVTLFVTEADTWTMVTLFTIVNESVPRSGALYKYVAEFGASNSFGGMSVVHNDDGTDNVNLAWTMFGMRLHPDDLREAVTAFALVSDRVDDEVHGLFGGRRFIG